MSNPQAGTISINGKDRYHEPAPDHIDVEEFRKVVISRRSVRNWPPCAT